LKESHVKKKLLKGGFCLGIFSNIPSPSISEIAGYAGFDFIIIDMEHGIMDFESVENMVRAADAVGISSIIRVPEARESYILRAVETGAQGVQVPHVEDRQTAELVVDSVKYAPLGNRGVSPYTRAANYSSLSPTEHFKKSNEETLVVLQIEGREGVENIESIVTVEGVDVLFAGPYDLSQSFGVTGDLDNPLVRRSMDKLIETCKIYGKWPGTFAPNIERARSWISAGMKYLAYSVDTGILYESLRHIVESVKSKKSD
jgi:4-hydroxy-2-oxoheptanedioate aldolase